MSLSPGTRLGPYEITAQIGVGGMGEVYKATDTNLKRAVAIKVLPDAVAADAERLARFQREAEVLASLNHPNIVPIYGLERSAATTALVMELVEGPTLADRITQGPIPVDEALPIAKQIAEALEAAHEQGIIHRDLKPANIKLRPDGTVKVLDFGLAKAVEQVGTSPSATQSPTITTPAMVTGVGVLLGTAAYMSPEQAKGRAADNRSDIWAFGCVLFEMLTGKRAFNGEDVGDTLANVLKVEPAWSALPSEASPAIRTLLRRCLEKDPRKRIAHVSVALFALEEGQHLSASPDPQVYILKETATAQTTEAISEVRGESSRSTRRRVAAVGATALFAGAAMGIAVWHAMQQPQGPARVQRFALHLPGRPRSQSTATIATLRSHPMARARYTWATTGPNSSSAISMSWMRQLLPPASYAGRSWPQTASRSDSSRTTAH
jgi:serine/threonine protein kinase